MVLSASRKARDKIKETTMHNFQQTVADLLAKARDIHGRERRMTLESVEVIGRLLNYRAHLCLHMSQRDFAAAIGITPSVLWKRAQAARVMARFPGAKALAETGEIEVSHLALLAPRITEANCDLLLSMIGGKSKREVERLVARVTPDGRLLAPEDEGVEVEIKLMLREDELSLLERAREVMAADGKDRCAGEASCGA